MEIRVLYVVRDVTKLLKVGFNFHYRKGQNYQSLFKMHYEHERVFPSKKSLLNWTEVYMYKPKEGKTGQKNSKEDMLLSVKKLQEEREVSITEVLADKEL